jgi:hypothetical protein
MSNSLSGLFILVKGLIRFVGRRVNKRSSTLNVWVLEKVIDSVRVFNAVKML